MKRIAIIGSGPHCSAICTTVARKIAEQPCAQGEVIEIQPALKNEVVYPITRLDIEPYTPTKLATAEFLKPDVYDYKRIRKAKRR